MFVQNKAVFLINYPVLKILFCFK